MASEEVSGSAVEVIITEPDETDADLKEKEKSVGLTNGSKVMCQCFLVAFVSFVYFLKVLQSCCFFRH